MEARKNNVNASKVSTILLIVAFVLITLVSFFLLTTVRKVEVNFATISKTDDTAIQKVVDKYVGKNITLVDIDELAESLSGFSCVEVVSVKKAFPNVITVSVKERREIYYLETDSEVLSIGEDGHLIEVYSKSEFEPSRDVIKLDVGKVNITDKTLGRVIKTDSDELMSSVFSMAKSINLTNCIKEISIVKFDAVGELSDVEFATYTGVKLCVQKAEEMGVEKIQRLFEVYDTKVSDYEKASDTLMAFYNSETGKIDVAWSDRNAE